MSVIFIGWVLLGGLAVCLAGFCALAYYVDQDLARFDHDAPQHVSPREFARVTHPWTERPSQYRKVE